MMLTMMATMSFVRRVPPAPCISTPPFVRLSALAELFSFPIFRAFPSISCSDCLLLQCFWFSASLPLSFFRNYGLLLPRFSASSLSEPALLRFFSSSLRLRVSGFLPLPWSASALFLLRLSASELSAVPVSSCSVFLLRPLSVSPPPCRCSAVPFFGLSLL